MGLRADGRSFATRRRRQSRGDRGQHDERSSFRSFESSPPIHNFTATQITMSAPKCSRLRSAEIEDRRGKQQALPDHDRDFERLTIEEKDGEHELFALERRLRERMVAHQGLGIEAVLRDELNDLEGEAERDQHRKLVANRLAAFGRASALRTGPVIKKKRPVKQKEMRRAEQQIELMFEPENGMPHEVERAPDEQPGDAEDALRRSRRERPSKTNPRDDSCANRRRPARLPRKLRRCTSSYAMD